MKLNIYNEKCELLKSVDVINEEAAKAFMHFWCKKGYYYKGVISGTPKTEWVQKWLTIYADGR